MNEDVIQNIRARMEKCRRLAEMVHQPDIRETLLQMARDGERDLERLTSDDKPG